MPADIPADELADLLQDEDARYTMGPLVASAAAEAGRYDPVPQFEKLLRDDKTRRDNWISMMTATALVTAGRRNVRAGDASGG